MYCNSYLQNLTVDVVTGQNSLKLINSRSCVTAAKTLYTLSIECRRHPWSLVSRIDELKILFSTLQKYSKHKNIYIDTHRLLSRICYQSEFLLAALIDDTSLIIVS